MKVWNVKVHYYLESDGTLIDRNLLGISKTLFGAGQQAMATIKHPNQDITVDSIVCLGKVDFGVE